MIEEALFDYLSGHPGLSALVDDRIYPDRLPETANKATDLPAIAWQLIDEFRTYTFDSFDDTAPWVTARYQLACWARKAVEALAAARQVIAALSGYQGDMAGEPVGSVFVVLGRSDYEAPTKLYRRLVDVSISYEEATVAS